jgi:hypothetical protein
VADQSAGIDIPDSGDFVAIQIELRGFGGAPVGGDLREFADDQRFDVRARSFFIIEICAHVSDVRISKTDDLACITGIGENFLVTGEAGIKNDFAAAARDRACCAAVKDASVFERENRGSVLNFVQRSLRSGTW